MNRYNFRLGALLYDDDNSAFKRSTTIRKIVESFFALTDNNDVLCNRLPILIKDTFDIEIHPNEIHQVIIQDRYFEFVSGNCYAGECENCNSVVRLAKKRHATILAREKNGSIYKFIDEYYYAQADLQDEISNEDFLVLIERFLYSIFVQNMEKSSIMFDLKMEHAEVLEDLGFDNEQKRIINDFLDYDDDGKNKAIFDIGSLALEFVILNGNIDLKTQKSNILKKTLYLDTNIIFRVLGINGVDRQQKVFNLLKRCIDTGQQLKISYASQKEFFESLNRHLNKVQDFKSMVGYTAPISDDVIRNYFETRSGNVKFYKAKIKAEYERTLGDLNIEIDEKDYDGTATGDQRMVINQYVSSISEFKHQRELEIRPDAVNIAYIQHLREGQLDNFRSLREFFLTSDKQLINWESAKITMYPVAMYPSNWLSIILKFGTRTSDDYKSFVSFIKNVYTEKKKDLDVVLSTLKVISMHAETAEKEKELYDIYVESEYDNILNIGSFREREKYIEATVPKYIEKMFNAQQAQIAEMQHLLDESNNQQKRHTTEIEEIREQDENRRIELINAKYDEVKSNRKLARYIAGSIIVIGGYFLINYVLSVLTFSPNADGLRTLTFTSKGNILDDIVSICLLPIVSWSVIKFINSLRKATLRDELLLKEITREEIDNLMK